jgi:hypothetical protein
VRYQAHMPARPRAPGAAAVRWLLWSAGAMALWLALTVSTQLDQLMAGVAASALAGALVEAVRAQAGLALEASAFPWRAAPRQALRVVLDAGLLGVALWRALVRREPVEGQLQIAPLPIPRRGPREAAIGSGSVYLGSLAPNTFVVGVDPEHQLVVYHQLVVRARDAPPGVRSPRP